MKNIQIRHQSALAHILPKSKDLPTSGISKIIAYGAGRPGILPLWVGEGERATPDFICQAAQASLDAGETFYSYQAGLPELRAAIAAYLTRLYRIPTAPERIFVTGSGMHALQIALTMTAGPGDEVIVPTPAWPNFVGAINVAGARPREVAMRFGNQGWQLDLDDIRAAITPQTRVLVVNSPANPTGWTASRDELQALLAMAREFGLWIIADEIYGRFVFEGDLAPSFREIMAPEDRILFIQTFSKNWAMTGWRVGWLEAPAELAEVITNLVQYSNSGFPVFSQRGALAAIAQGDNFIAEQIALVKTNRAILMERLGAVPRLRIAPPQGAFYLFFGVESDLDSLALAYAMVDKANVGMAPGGTFGAVGAGFLRLCYLRNSAEIEEACRRIARAVEAL